MMSSINGLLFIDDEEGVRRSIKRALKKEPYQIYTAETGEKGIKILKDNIYDIITVISDYKMPGLDGLETLTRIGALNPEITRILLTGYASMEAAILATNKGIDGFLLKPFDNLELRANINNISLRKRLRQFVPEQIYSELEQSRGFLKPAFHEASILFADIRGFTSMSQNIPPEAIASFLNDQYFSPMGEIAFKHHGTVDKHIGDGIMIVFGAPVAHDDDVLKAVTAAVEIQQKAAEIDRGLKQKNGLRLKLGIGIATGAVFSGVLGSLRKKEYTSIGMAVNIASRLQGLAGPGEILISEASFHKIEKSDLAGTLKVEAMGPTSVKGLNEPINTYRITF